MSSSLGISQIFTRIALHEWSCRTARRECQSYQARRSARASAWLVPAGIHSLALRACRVADADAVCSTHSLARFEIALTCEVGGSPSEPRSRDRGHAVMITEEGRGQARRGRSR